MDLKNFVPSKDNVEVELKINDKNLKNPDGSNMTITVMSPYSKEYKGVLNTMSNERIKQRSQDKEDKTDKVEDFEDFSLTLLSETTVDWNITWDGEKPKFDKALAKQIYTDAFWIKLLISEAQAKLVDFTIP